MRDVARRFNLSSDDLSNMIGGSRVRFTALETALVITRSDAPAAEALVYFNTPHPEIGRVRVKYRDAEAEHIRQPMRRGWIR